jgi:hypothetical protein
MPSIRKEIMIRPVSFALGIVLAYAMPAMAQKKSQAQFPPPVKPIGAPLLKQLTQTLLQAAKPRLALQRETAPPDAVTGVTVEGDDYYSRTGTVKWSVTTEIQKTGSPASPYLGLVIHRVEMRRTPKINYPTRAEAEAAPLTEVTDMDTIFTFAYQNGKWVYQGTRSAPMRRSAKGG